MGRTNSSDVLERIVADDQQLQVTDEQQQNWQACMQATIDLLDEFEGVERLLARLEETETTKLRREFINKAILALMAFSFLVFIACKIAAHAVEVIRST